MPRLATPPTIQAAHVVSRHGISYIVFAVLAVAHAYCMQWMWQTVGEPFRTVQLQNEQIQVTKALQEGTETRNIVQLQSGLTRAAELAAFNETLFDESKTLHRAMRTRMEALAVAVEKGEVVPLAAALRAAIESHTDGLPFIDRYHLRTAAKKLQAQAQAEAEAAAASKAAAAVSEDELAALYAEVRGAIELSRGSENEASAVEEEEKKLPSKWMPSFWVRHLSLSSLLAPCPLPLAPSRCYSRSLLLGARRWTSGPLLLLTLISAADPPVSSVSPPLTLYFLLASHLPHRRAWPSSAV